MILDSIESRILQPFAVRKQMNEEETLDAKRARLENIRKALDTDLMNTFRNIQGYTVNAFTQFGEQTARFAAMIGDAFEVEMVSSRITVPIARRFPEYNVSQTHKGETAISWTLGEEEYEVCILVSFEKDEDGILMTPPRFRVNHDLGDEFGVGFRSVSSIDDVFRCVEMMKGAIDSDGLEFIRRQEAK